MRAATEISLRSTGEEDLDFVLAAERAPEALAMVSQSSRERHREAIARDDEDHLVVLADGERAGFALLQDVGGEDHSVALRRFVITMSGQGIGRRAARLVADRCFTVHGANRVWLDTFPHNERAQRAYTAAGFVHEGVLREALLKDGRYESLVVMSILRSEWSGPEDMAR